MTIMFEKEIQTQTCICSHCRSKNNYDNYNKNNTMVNVDFNKHECIPCTAKHTCHLNKCTEDTFDNDENCNKYTLNPVSLIKHCNDCCPKTVIYHENKNCEQYIESDKEYDGDTYSIENELLCFESDDEICSDETADNCNNNYAKIIPQDVNTNHYSSGSREPIGDSGHNCHKSHSRNPSQHRVPLGTPRTHYPSSSYGARERNHPPTGDMPPRVPRSSSLDRSQAHLGMRNPEIQRMGNSRHHGIPQENNRSSYRDYVKDSSQYRGYTRGSSSDRYADYRQAPAVYSSGHVHDMPGEYLNNSGDIPSHPSCATNYNQYAKSYQKDPYWQNEKHSEMQYLMPDDKMYKAQGYDYRRKGSEYRNKELDELDKACKYYRSISNNVCNEVEDYRSRKPAEPYPRSSRVYEEPIRSSRPSERGGYYSDHTYETRTPRRSSCIRQSEGNNQRATYHSEDDYGCMSRSRRVPGDFMAPARERVVAGARPSPKSYESENPAYKGSLSYESPRIDNMRRSKPYTPQGSSQSKEVRRPSYMDSYKSNYRPSNAGASHLSSHNSSSHYAY